MRASIYNAMPIEGVEALVEFMKKFEKENYNYVSTSLPEPISQVGLETFTEEYVPVSEPGKSRCHSRQKH